MAHKLLSRRAADALSALETNVRDLANDRNAAYRILTASRSVASDSAQREYWLEFAWLDQEYRYAVRRLAQFCCDQWNEVDARRS
jgi:hypothetical protein